jgi:nicotinamidase-related amidase
MTGTDTEPTSADTTTPRRRALLVIDVQESFRARATDWNRMHNPNVAEQVNRLVDAARASGDLVVWVLHSEPGTDTVFDPAQGLVRPLAELSPQVDEPTVVKTSINAFTTTNLQQQLVQRGIRELIICGIRTEQCCETTARVGADLGFDITFVTDATTTSGIDGLDAAAIIERAERVLAAREFARIATTDEIVAAAPLMGSALA